VFALTFSFGHVYPDDSKTVADFWLKVVINAVNDDRLRSVERSNIVLEWPFEILHKPRNNAISNRLGSMMH
jgi:uncharacterized protein (TIGR04141 family)